mgnify:CR=1 FL=1
MGDVAAGAVVAGPCAGLVAVLLLPTCAAVADGTVSCLVLLLDVCIAVAGDAVPVLSLLLAGTAAAVAVFPTSDMA